MKKLYIALLSVLVACLLSVGLLSVTGIGTEATLESEGTVKKPAFSMQALLNGSYIAQLEDYYAKTFPLRTKLLDANIFLNKFYSFSVKLPGGAHNDTPEGSIPSLVIPMPGDPGQSGSATQDPSKDDPTPVTPPPEEKPVIDVPDKSEAVTLGAVTIVRDRAMDIPSYVSGAVNRYAEMVSKTAEAFGEDVNVFALVTPNAAQWYTPESMHTGSHDQKEMINRCYLSMDDAVTVVDAYSALEYHTDEYIYFRSDHHWTQLGAYYAYTAFCKAAGLEAKALTDFESGTAEGYLGYLYSLTRNYAQSKVLKDNPDAVTYYLPTVETKARYYNDFSLSTAYKISVVSTSWNPGSYMCFLSGDHPVTIIESEAEGGTIMVVKDSYANALIPFLTEHYSKIIVVDARYFNASGYPNYNELVSFAKEQGITDFLFLNYIFNINNSSYISKVEALLNF